VSRRQQHLASSHPLFPGAPDTPSLRAAAIGPGSTGAAVRLLTPAQRRRLAEIASVEQVPARSIVYRQGTPATMVFVCGGGVLKSYRQLPSGTRRIALFLFKDDLFGLPDHGTYMNTAQAITPARVYRLPVDELADVLRRDPDLEFQFLCKVTHELRESQRRSILLGRRDAPGRLAMFLVMMQRTAPLPRDPAAVAIPMSRTDVAEFLALSPEAVSRAANALVRRGLVRFENRHLARVVDRIGLQSLASRL